jgi:hypothetical protein
MDQVSPAPVVVVTVGLPKDATEAEIVAAGRGVWRASAARAASASHLVICVRGTVRVVLKITSLDEGTRADGKTGVIFNGTRVRNHPLVGRPSPIRFYGQPVRFLQLDAQAKSVAA